MPDYPKQHNDDSDLFKRLDRLNTAIIESFPIGIVTFDKNLKIIKANAQALKLLDLEETIDKSLAKGTDDKIWQGWTEQMTSVLSKNEATLFDDVDYTSHGERHVLRIMCSSLKDAATAGSLGATMMIEDVTDKVTMQKRLENTERLAMIGRHASKVAHELNNPLDGILRYLNLAMRIVEQENLEKPIEYLSQCRRGLMRMVQIVGELLEYARSTYAPTEHVQIEQLIEDAIKTMESRAETSEVTIVRDYASGLPKIRSINLFQVFCNLIKNALDAMEHGGRLTISTHIGQDNNVIAEFHDTGTGLPPNNIETIFEPFFTTKGDRKGSGLGLAICRDIIESHHGRITAKNAPEGGSIFTVYVPVNK